MWLKTKAMDSHYDWLSKNLGTFLDNLGLDVDQADGLIRAHGDKGYSYRMQWEDAGLRFEQAMAIFLLSYVRPYSKEVRKLDDGIWVNVADWVVNQFNRFKEHLPQE